MEELIRELKHLCDEMKVITELTKKYKEPNIISEMLFYKNLEDGILSKLLTANLHQLNMLKRNCFFRYYGKDLTDNLIDIAIKKITRKEKLNKICNHET